MLSALDIKIAFEHIIKKSQSKENQRKALKWKA